MRKLTISAAFVALMTVNLGVAYAEESKQDVYDQLQRFGEVFERVRENYVEEVDSKELIEAAINGMLTSLDPHSSYLSPDDYTEMNEDTSGEFGGLGIEVTQEEGLVKVVSPIDDTPAFEAGVQAGDYISHVDGEALMGLSLDEAVDMMRGPVGTTITITILREGAEEPFDVEITRDIIKVSSAKVASEGDVIVVRIAQFNEQTMENIEKGIAKTAEELGGMDAVEGFVIDLRNNPGGLLTTAIDVSDAFLDQGEIVSTRGRHDYDNDRANAEKGDLAKGKPLVVLINGGSASASEIVAGALQDQKRAVVVGTTSFGKGSVQTIMPIGDDSAIRLTTARYYTPSGRSIQGLGVAPDVYVEQPRRAPVDPNAEEDTPASTAFGPISEGDLRGAISNDSLSDEERALIEADREKQKASAELRERDYQLGYAIDVLHSINVLDDE